MSHDDIAAWESFAVALVGASAVLAGLIFLAVTINIDRILSVPGLPGRAGENLILFLAALGEAAFVLIPGQPVTALGVELIASGAVALGLLAALVLPAMRRPSRQPRTWRAARVITALAATVPVVLAGLSLLGALPGGLYWFVGGVLAAIFIATANAWVLLVEVVRDKRYRPL
jgi:modulator of FtsH protease